MLCLTLKKHSFLSMNLFVQLFRNLVELLSNSSQASPTGTTVSPPTPAATQADPTQLATWLSQFPGNMMSQAPIWQQAHSPTQIYSSARVTTVTPAADPSNIITTLTSKHFLQTIRNLIMNNPITSGGTTATLWLFNNIKNTLSKVKSKLGENTTALNKISRILKENGDKLKEGQEISSNLIKAVNTLSANSQINQNLLQVNTSKLAEVSQAYTIMKDNLGENLAIQNRMISEMVTLSASLTNLLTKQTEMSKLIEKTIDTNRQISTNQNIHLNENSQATELLVQSVTAMKDQFSRLIRLNIETINSLRDVDNSPIHQETVQPLSTGTTTTAASSSDPNSIKIFPNRIKPTAEELSLESSPIEVSSYKQQDSTSSMGSNSDKGSRSSSLSSNAQYTPPKVITDHVVLPNKKSPIRRPLINNSAQTSAFNPQSGVSNGQGQAIISRPGSPTGCITIALSESNIVSFYSDGTPSITGYSAVVFAIIVLFINYSVKPKSFLTTKLIISNFIIDFVEHYSFGKEPYQFK